MRQHFRVGSFHNYLIKADDDSAGDGGQFSVDVRDSSLEIAPRDGLRRLSGPTTKIAV